MLPNSYDLFISSGISNDITLETNFLDLYPDIRCYAFDGTISSLPVQHNRITFFKKNLSDCNNDKLTNLHEYIERYNNIFMKIDIEGHEFKIMPTIIKNKLMNKIKQFVIEIHTPADINMFPEYFKGLSDINNNDIITDDDMRNAFEKAISICGIDIIDGSIIWKRYRDFELQEHLNKIEDGALPEELQLSKTRVIKVFTRNLSIPLADILQR